MPDVDDGDEMRALLASAHPQYALELDLLRRCGSHLAAVLHGDADSRTLLFADESYDTMRTFYREAPTSRLYNVLAGEAIGRLAASATQTRPLRILEIGGGTGGTTVHVLPHLASEAIEYVFTDVSPFFTQRAMDLVGGRPGFSARVLDIETDPAAQGFATASFDLVVASNVLHTTPRLGDSLAQVERLIAPGGALVLMEVTRHPHWADLVFGVTDGWWRFTDHELRPHHPILPEAGWRALLSARGWSGIETISDTDRPGEAAQTVIAAQWNRRSAPDLDRAWLVFADRGGIASRVIERLGRVIVIHPGDGYRRIDARSFEVTPGNRDHLVEMFSALDPEHARFDAALHCWSLDAVPSGRLSPTLLHAAHRAGTDSVLALLQALGTTGRAIPDLWLVTSGSQPMTAAPEILAVAQAPIWGLSRVINKEQRDVRCHAVDLSGTLDDRDVAMLIRELDAGAGEDELAFRDGTRFVRRLRRSIVTEQSAPGVTHAPAADEAWQVEVATPGVIGSIALRQTRRAKPGPDEVEVRVCAASLNFREVVLATNAIPDLERESPWLRRQLGVDCAGIVSAVGDNVELVRAGDEVVAFAAGTHRAFAITSLGHVLQKPAALTFEEAAAVPAVFLTAYYALRHLAGIRAGDRVLIHAATGGVGLAAIEIARDAGAEIFATAGSPEKRAHLAAMGITHVMNSRTLEFADEIRSITSGHGVDIVLNSLAGDAMVTSMSVLAPFGRFVEIGKKDLYADSRVAIGALRQNIAYHTLDLDLLVADRPVDVRRCLAEIFEAIAAGRYRLPPITTLPFSRTGDAVRMMAQSRHIGKIVLTASDPDLKVLAPRHSLGSFTGGTVLITGGMGGFGFAVAERLARLGVGDLVLAGRGNSGGANDPRLAALTAAGATTAFIACDVTDEHEVVRMMATIRETMPPLRGIVHAAMVLDDAPLGQIDSGRLDRVLDSKVTGAWNLHAATIDVPLDCFVMFSSITSLLGSPLQSNYAAANAFLDAFCFDRRARGLAAQTINWGILSGIGWVAEHVEIGKYLARQGYLTFSPDQALETFEHLLRLNPVHVMAARIDWKAWAKSSPVAASSPRLRHFSATDDADAPGTRTAGDGPLISLLAASAADRPARLDGYLRERVGKVLGLAPARIDVECPLNDMGLDSLIAVELMTILKMELSVALPVVTLLQGITITKLATLVSAQIGPPGSTATAKTSASASQVAAATASGPMVRVPAAQPVGAAVGVTPAIPMPTAGKPAPSPPATGDGRSATFDRRQRLARHMIGAAFRATTKLDVEGLEHLPVSGGCIVTANHLSLIDAPLLFSVLSRPTVLFASDHLRRSAFMNWMLADIGDAIWVRRGEGDQDALDQGLRVLERGDVIGIGPEGTRSHTGSLGLAHTGWHISRRAAARPSFRLRRGDTNTWDATGRVFGARLFTCASARRFASRAPKRPARGS